MKRTKVDSEKTRDQLLDAAQSLFGSRGYSRTTLQDVVQEAGLTRGAIYWHFDSKAALFQAVLDRMFRQVGLWSEKARLFEGSPCERIIHYVEGMIRLILDHPPYKALQEVMLYEPEWREELKEVYRVYYQQINQFRQTLLDLFGQAVKARSLPETLDLDLTITLLFAFIGGLRLMKDNDALGLHRDLNAEKLTRYFIKTCLPLCPQG